MDTFSVSRLSNMKTDKKTLFLSPSLSGSRPQVRPFSNNQKSVHLKPHSIYVALWHSYSCSPFLPLSDFHLLGLFWVKTSKNTGIK